MQELLPEKITKYLSENEQVLWWAKPNICIRTRLEKSMMYLYGIAAFLISMFVSISLSFVQSVFAALCVSCLTAAILVMIIFIVFAIRKYVTWFIITDQRVMDVSCYNHNTCEIKQRKLSDIYKYEIYRLRNGGTLHLGKYRYSFFGGRYDYLTKSNGPESISKSFFPIYTAFKENKEGSYLAFFSLRDPEIPAQIIRERTSAKEYIDPKRKQKESN